MKMEQKRTGRAVYPMLVVLSALSIIEIAMTILYPRLSEAWEKVPILLLLLVIPISVITTFLYLWVRRPGHLYPPSEFGSGQTAEVKLAAFSCNLATPAAGLEKEFNRVRAMQARAPSGESVIWVLALEKYPDTFYCQCSFSLHPDHDGVFKFLAAFEELTRLLPEVVERRSVTKIILDQRETFRRFLSAPGLKEMTPLFSLEQDS